jgi:hypothetical protein
VTGYARLKTTLLTFPLFLNVALCHWVSGAQHFQTTMLSQNVGHQSPGDTGPHPRRKQTSTTLLQKPKNLTTTSLLPRNC